MEIDEFITAMEGYSIDNNDTACEGMTKIKVNIKLILNKLKHFIQQMILNLRKIKSKIEIDNKLKEYSDTLYKKIDSTMSHLFDESMTDQIKKDIDDIKDTKEWTDLFDDKSFIPSNNKVSISTSEIIDHCKKADKQVEWFENVIISTPDAKEDDIRPHVRMGLELAQMLYKVTTVVLNRAYNKETILTDLGGKFEVVPEM